MKINDISISQYRNITQLNIQFPADAALFVGRNGQGKTNILEAIHLLSRSISFRSKNYRELIQLGQTWFRLSANLTDGQGMPHSIAIAAEITNKATIRKKITYDEVEISAKELAGLIPSVTFLPTELDLFAGSPQLRRNILNASLIQTDKNYYTALQGLAHTLKSRGKLLKAIRDGFSDAAELEFWDQSLIELNEQIGLKRLEFIEHLSELLEETYNTIAGGASHSITIHYKPTTDLAAHLKNNQQREIILGQTLKGPHREDFHIEIDGKSFKSFGSRGEHRSIILALKIAELKYLHKQLNIAPILLLDDVMSELDAHRQEALLKSIDGIQTVITTTNADVFPESESYSIYEVEDAQICN